MHKGIEEDGEHLCLALELQRASLDSVLNTQSVKFYPLPIIKRVLRHVLHGMAALHKCGVVHTGTSFSFFYIMRHQT